MKFEYGGKIIKGEGCFRDVMSEFPYEQLWALLNDPRPIDETTLEYIINWCHPNIFKGWTFVDAVLESGVLKTKSEISRNRGAMKWNGQRVTNVNMIVEFFEPGWGVIQLGKKTHGVLLDRWWVRMIPNFATV